MKCEEVEKQISLCEPLKAEAQKHLLECSSCQEFSLANSIMANGGRPVPGQRLDAAVLSDFRKDCAERQFSAGFTELPSFSLAALRHCIYAAAAAVILLLALWATGVNVGTMRNLKSGEPDLQTSWLLNASMAADEMDELEMVLSAITLQEEGVKEPPSVNGLIYGIIGLEADLLYEL